MQDTCQDLSLCRFALRSTERQYLSSPELDARRLALEKCMGGIFGVGTALAHDHVLALVSLFTFAVFTYLLAI